MIVQYNTIQNDVTKDSATERVVILNTAHYAAQVKETEEGIIVDVFHRNGDLISTETFWNDDVIASDT